MNAATLCRSPRLQATLAALEDAGLFGLTTRELMLATGSCAPHSDVAELRANGVPVRCEQERCTTSGRRVYRYRLGG